MRGTTPPFKAARIVRAIRLGGFSGCGDGCSALAELDAAERACGFCGEDFEVSEVDIAVNLGDSLCDQHHKMIRFTSSM